MSEDDTNKELPEPEETKNEFELEDFEINPISSAELIKTANAEEETGEESIPQFLEAEEKFWKESEIEQEEAEEVDPIFAELAAPVLPELARENRAWLQIQSPNRIYFYWAIKNNPFQTLQKIFAGSTGSYQLVAKFVNLKNDREEIRAVDAEGNYWFNAESDSSYRAEIGFYAPNRPYIRVIFSNTIETPRRSPSPRAASESEWAISANAFAQVLDNSGFTQDAYEVALAGDDFEVSEKATQNALVELVGEGRWDFGSVNADEVRFALLALASGATLESLRGQISEALFIILQEQAARLSAENALAALKENFEVFDEEIFEEEEFGAAVYGASLVNFPKSIRKRTVPRAGAPKEDLENAPKFIPKLSPLSSLRN